MKRAQRAICVGLALAAALLPQSCNNSYGIFEEVQKEREQVGQDIFEKKSVPSIVRLDAGAGNVRYYAATSRLYSRSTDSGSSWSLMSVDGLTSYCVYGLVATSAAVYVSTDQGVYSYDGSTWTALTSPTPSFTLDEDQSFYTDALFAAGSEVYVVGHLYDDSDSTESLNYYGLYRLVGTSFSQLVAAMSSSDYFGGALSEGESIRGVALYSGEYWYAASSHLYGAGGTSSAVGTQVSFSRTIWNITSTASGDLYITSTDGCIYRDGTSDYKDFTDIPLSAVVEVPMSGTAWRILVGSESIDSDYDPEGYFEAGNDIGTALASTTFGDGEDGTVTYSSSVYSSTVYDMPVHAFLYDGDLSSGTLFIAISPYSSSTTHYGLYSTTWDGSSWSGWDAE